MTDRNDDSSCSPSIQKAGEKHQKDSSKLTMNGERTAKSGDEKNISKSMEDEIEEELNNMLPMPPDGGYGWVIVFAAFMSNFVVDGICNSFGAFMSIYQDYFGASKAKVSLIGSLLIGFYLLIGPIAGGLVNRYGARIVVIVGSIVSGAALLASTVATNIYVFMLLYGALGGCGFGLIYLPSIVTVGYYFEKKRSMATGIAVAGSGVGTFVLPPLCIFLINQIGWQMTVVTLSGLGFASVFFGLLYRPLSTPAIEQEKETQKSDVEMPMRFTASSDRDTNDIDSDGRKIVSATEAGPQKRTRNATSECEFRHELAPNMDKSRDITSSYGKERNAVGASADVSSSDLTRTSRSNLAGSLARMSARSYAQSVGRLSQTTQIKGTQSLLSVAGSVNPKEFSKPMNRRDIFFSGSIKNLPEFQQEGGNYQSYRQSQTSIPAAMAEKVTNWGQIDGDTDNKMDGSRISGGGLGLEEDIDYYDDSKCKWIPLSIRNVFSEMVDLSLLADPIMLLLCISNLLGMLGFYVPFMFLIDMAVASGHSKTNGSLLLSVIGVTNTVGRIISGWLADQGWLSALTINNMSLILCGILTCICPLTPSFAGMMVYSILFGLIISAYISLTSIVLVEELGLERLTNSFGLLVVSRGIASLLGTPIAGIVYDLTASYDASFYFAGVIIILSGVVSCFIPLIHKRRRDLGAKGAVKEIQKSGDEADAVDKLSVVSEHSEENLTDQQRTIQSLRQQQKLMKEMDECEKLIPLKNEQKD